MVQPVDSALLHGHNEQAMIELIYIKVANKVLGGHMEDLEKALSSIKTIVNALTNLQNAKNQLKVSSRSVPTFDENDYESVTSEVFGSPLTPSLIDGYDYDQINDYADQLKSALNQLLDVLPGGASGAEAEALKDDPNSIWSLGNKVVDTIDSVGPEDWVMDRYNEINTSTVGNAGQYQSDLTLAITAAQSLNDNKKEEVRRFLYIFEEYYKSAASVLNKITQILEGMARNISKS